MKNTTFKIDLSSIKFDLYRTWDEIAPDAGPCSAIDKAELVIDRLPDYAREVVRSEIDLNGYLAVRKAVADLLRGV